MSFRRKLVGYLLTGFRLNDKYEAVLIVAFKDSK